MQHHHTFALGAGIVMLLGGCARGGETPEAREQSAPMRPAVGAPAPRTGCTHNFARFDTDGDGRISRSEFLAQPHARANPEAMFDTRDGNRDQYLSESEFCSGWRGGGMEGRARMRPGMGPPGAGAGMPPQPGMGPGPGPGMQPGMGMQGGMGPMGAGRGGTPMRTGMSCEEHFARFDANADGRLTLEELSAWPQAAGDAQVVFQARDKDGDGAVTQSEFCAGWSPSPVPAK